MKTKKIIEKYLFPLFFRDRIRTAANVLSHTCCAAIAHRYCGQDLGTTKDLGMLEQEMELIVHAPETRNCSVSVDEAPKQH